jgi:osmotically-inducible protein OsmY
MLAYAYVFRRTPAQMIDASTMVAWMLVALLVPVRVQAAEHNSSSGSDALDTIVVQGDRYADAARDEQLRVAVKTALHDAPYFYDEHVTVTVRGGIVYLEGWVLDFGDVSTALRILRKRFPRVKRFVNELEVARGDSDDG